MSNELVVGSKFMVKGKRGTIVNVYPHGAILVRFENGDEMYLTKGQIEHGV